MLIFSCTFSMRWKMLLGFSCRNRLLLSGTPIQNSMAELWALLHFIMPSMFDSHNEFNEWFSKDIESHAENKTSIDESEFLVKINISVINIRWYFRVSSLQLSGSPYYPDEQNWFSIIWTLDYPAILRIIRTVYSTV